MTRARRLIGPLLIFFGCVVLLSYLSGHRWFWSDEASSTEHSFFLKWLDLAIGRTAEGNSGPLYFFILKLVVRLQPAMGRLGLPGILWIRLMTGVIPMAASAVYVYCMARRVDFGLKSPLKDFFPYCFALAFIGNYSFFEYGWQARHYALWIFGSIVFWDQLVRFRFRWPLIVGMWLLCSLTVFGALQVACGGVFLALCRQPWPLLRKYALLAAAPVVYAAVCHWVNGSDLVYRWPGFKDMFFIVMAVARWWLVIGVALALLALWRTRSFKPLLSFVACSGLMTLGLVLLFWSQRHRQYHTVFDLSDRYFLFLFAQLSTALLIGVERFAAETKRFQKRRLYKACVAGLMVVLAAKGLTQVRREIARISPLPTVESVVKPELEPIFAADPGRCFCIVSDEHDVIEVSEWATQMLVVRSHNAAIEGCDDRATVRISVVKPSGGAQARFRVAPSGRHDGTFNPEAAICAL